MKPTFTEHNLRARLAMNVRNHREAAHLTLEEAAARASLHWRHWQKVEAGEVSATLRTLTKLANALNIDPSELIASPPKRVESDGAV